MTSSCAVKLQFNCIIPCVDLTYFKNATFSLTSFMNCLWFLSHELLILNVDQFIIIWHLLLHDLSALLNCKCLVKWNFRVFLKLNAEWRNVFNDWFLVFDFLRFAHWFRGWWDCSFIRKKFIQRVKIQIRKASFIVWWESSFDGRWSD